MVTKLVKIPEQDGAETSQYWMNFRDSEGWWSGFVKWDGCIEINRYYNLPMDYPDRDSLPAGQGEPDNIHICDLDDYITMLQGLRDLAKEHFGKDWE